MCGGELTQAVFFPYALISFSLNISVIERYLVQYLVCPKMYLLCGKQVQTDDTL